MCRAGVYHCPDRRVLKNVDLSELRPAAEEQVPAVDWGEHPSTADLYEQYDPKVADATVATLRRTCQAEPEMTRDIVTSLPQGVRAHGLEFRVKSPQSLARKIRTRTESRAASGLSADQHADRLTDVVRYTAVCQDPDKLTSTAQTTLATLQEQGWEVVEAEHSYVAGSPYKGLHTLARKGSITAELQFHTEASQAVKDKYHVEYEVSRDPKTPLDQRLQADETMRKAWDAVPTPNGLTALKSLGGVPLATKTY